jgi:hypothetical protein
MNAGPVPADASRISAAARRRTASVVAASRPPDDSKQASPPNRRERCLLNRSVLPKGRALGIR